ncbi:HemK2/MTQ2 family protein methyltransferase [Mycolicibacterium sp.]|uniref:HemK2/MTQ2 family protein methyltransferase n=1 Tax=Mycolicibacterium sp. TaxID=2320850 RepID=UPI001A360D51|nr:HemK2/MTQ2 family protein methyltransferase [Mycolicibacterium sp.]MBJ7340345.1 methyltransferase [Mycolicibacterium sp.]
MVTITAPPLHDIAVAAPGVYHPQEDSRLLIDALQQNVALEGRTALDLCTGTGVVAIAAALLGAARVTAWDICPRAVQCSRSNVAAAGVAVEVVLGSWALAQGRGRFDVVLANPPYVPFSPDLPAIDGPAQAWDAGSDGRLVIDPLCTAAPGLLNDGGTMLLVQSEFTGVEQSLAALTAAGLRTSVVARQRIPFGPVMTSRANWLESTGRSPVGRREEELTVIRADKR